MRKIVWSVLALVVIGLAIFATPVYKLAVIKVAEYRWQQMMEKSLVETKQLFDTTGHFPVDPRGVMATLRVGTFENSLQPAFKKERAWEMLYCAFSLPHWDYYKVSKKLYEQPLLKMRERMMASAKSYFADTTNLQSFYQKHKEEIMDSYANLDVARKSEFQKMVTSTIVVFDNVLQDVAIDSTDYYETYLKEYALRRLDEGGKPLVQCYHDIAVDIRSMTESSIKKTEASLSKL